tara:strand:- start:3499 stop:4842 length:1344 start_codon:yes stop_codon:yes gene_type:complete
MNAHILRWIARGAAKARGPFSSLAQHSLSRVARNMPNFLQGAYAGRLARIGAFAKGTGKGLTNTAKHWASPEKTKLFREMGISPGTKDIVDNALHRIYLINRQFKGKKIPSKWQHELNSLERQIYGQLAQEKTLALSYGQKPSGLLNRFMGRHMREYDMSGLPALMAKRQVKGGGSTKATIWNKDTVMADQILKGHGSSLDDLATGKISGKILDYKSTALNTSLRDAQYSKQAASMFKSFHKGARSVEDFARISSEYGIKDGFFKQLPDGRITAIFSPARKGNYQWGGFRGQINFDPKTNKVTIYASDKFDLGGTATGLITRRGMQNKEIINIMAPSEKTVPEILEKMAKANPKVPQSKTPNKPLGRGDYKKDIKPLKEPTKEEILSSFKINKGIFSNKDADNLIDLVRYTDNIKLTSQDLSRFYKSRAATTAGLIGGAGLLGMASE